jgi:hypothetical protein
MPRFVIVMQILLFLNSKAQRHAQFIYLRQSLFYGACPEEHFGEKARFQFAH